MHDNRVVNRISTLENEANTNLTGKSQESDASPKVSHTQIHEIFLKSSGHYPNSQAKN